MGIHAEIKEPSFIGEAVLLVNDSTSQKLDKEIARFRNSPKLTPDAWVTTTLTIDTPKANVRVPKGQTPKIIVKANDNESDPMTIINIYKLDAKKNKREVKIGKSQGSKTNNNTKSLVSFNADSYGEKSYIIELPNLAPGEYGIIVTNPNGLDEKRTIVSCFAID